MWQWALLNVVLPIVRRFLVIAILPKLFSALFVVASSVRAKVDAQSEGGKLITLTEWADIIGVASAELAKILTDAFASKLHPDARKLAAD